MLNKRKAQMEIMGLALIVILLGLGILFSIQWSQKTQSTIPQTKQGIQASTFLHTLVNTNTECHGLSISELLQDCALKGGAITCEAKNSCEYAKDTIGRIIASTLDKWHNKKYQLEITGADAVANIKFPQTTQKICKKEKESKNQIITITTGFYITLTLDIC